MIDKQKLLQWIAEEKNVYSGPYSSIQDRNKCEGALKMLSKIEREIESGEFDAE